MLCTWPLLPASVRLSARLVEHSNAPCMEQRRQKINGWAVLGSQALLHRKLCPNAAAATLGLMYTLHVYTAAFPPAPFGMSPPLPLPAFGGIRSMGHSPPSRRLNNCPSCPAVVSLLPTLPLPLLPGLTSTKNRKRGAVFMRYHRATSEGQSHASSMSWRRKTTRARCCRDSRHTTSNSRSTSLQIPQLLARVGRGGGSVIVWWW
jgi:hypothetical protein